MASRSQAAEGALGLSDGRRDAILHARAARLASRSERPESIARERLLVCAIEGSLYGFSLGEVAKVRPFERRGIAPGMAPAALGLVVDNGEIRPALDLAALLGRPTPAPASTGWLLLLAPPLSAALRVEEMPVAGELEASGGPEPDRGRVVGGEHHGKVVVRLSAADLLASQANP